MHKQMIAFTEPQIAWLRNEARILGIPVAELVRRTVDEYRKGSKSS